MNAQRFASIERNLNGIERKVLNAVPINEKWSQPQVIAEIKRVGSRMDVAVFEGALGALLNRGLISKDVNYRYQRVMPHIAQPKEESIAMNPKSAPQPTLHVVTNPTDSLASLAKQLRQMAVTANAAAQQIEEAALDFEAQLESAQTQLEQFRQLQTLLAQIRP